MDHTKLGATLPSAYLTQGTSSFTDFLRAQAPHLLPSQQVLASGSSGKGVELTHGTTIVAIAFKGGVLIAGDRRGTQGNMIAFRDIQKVFVTDNYSAVGIAGVAGIAVEIIRLYAVELLHYEKIEGVPLSLDGKANKLAGMVKGNLDAAMAGLSFVPLFVGYDVESDDPDNAGKIVTYDITGAPFREQFGYHAIGSGSLFAKSALKKLYDPNADQDAAVRIAIEALFDAADDDSATGGPDLVRQIFPNVITITAEHGAVELPQAQTAEVAAAVVADRQRNATR